MAVTTNVSVMVNGELVVVAIGPKVVKDAEGVIITSVTKELGIGRLESDSDIGKVVRSTTDVLGNSNTEVVSTSEEPSNVAIDGDVINKNEVGSIIAVLLGENTIDGLKDIGKSIVVWSVEIEIVGRGIVVDSSTENTGEDGRMVTTGMLVAVKMGSEENETVGNCTVVGIMMLVLAITSVTAVVRNT